MKNSKSKGEKFQEMYWTSSRMECPFIPSSMDFRGQHVAALLLATRKLFSLLSWLFQNFPSQKFKLMSVSRVTIQFPLWKESLNMPFSSLQHLISPPRVLKNDS